MIIKVGLKFIKILKRNRKDYYKWCFNSSSWYNNSKLISI